MYKFVWHEIEKGARVIILPPPIDEILKDDFNYPDYITKYLIQNQVYDEEYITKLFFNELSDYEIIEENNPLRDMLIDEGLNEAYEKEIIEIQKIYETDLKEKKYSIDYTSAMKKIAKKYYDILKIKKTNIKGAKK